MKKEKRKRRIGEKTIVKVLEHLNKYWKEDTEIGYLYKIYKKIRRRQRNV